MIKIEKVSFCVKDNTILEDVSFVLNDKDRIGLVGPNGSGKSTLLKIIAGILKPTTGIVSNPNYKRIAYFPQEIVKEDEELTVTRYIALFQNKPPIKSYTTLKDLEITEEVLNKKMKELSGGQKTRVCIAAIMLSDREIILLDEPTNNLDLAGIEILENFIQSSTKTFIIVSHDRKFLNTVTKKIISLEKNKAGLSTYNISFDEFLKFRTKERVVELRQYNAAIKEQRRLKKTFIEKQAMAIEAEKSRNKNDNEKLSFNAKKNRAAKKIMKNAKAIESRMKRLDEVDKPLKELNLNYIFKDNTLYLSDVIANIDNVLFSYNGSTDIIGPLNLKINRRDRVVIVGPNGIGKTTLFKLLLGDIKPNKGHITIGPSVKFGLIDQEQSFPQPDQSAFSNLRILIGNRSTDTKEQGKLRGMLHSMGVENLENKPNELSPGERSKILVAALALRGCNVLLFDEPTNHLDLNSIEEIEKALIEYKGTFIIISHDRKFIENIKPSKILEFSKMGVKES